MSINVTGPDGSSIQFPDGTPEAEITSALDTHYGRNVPRETQGQGGDRSPSLPEGVVRATATGVPVAGGLLNKLDAATNAMLAPLLDKYLPNSFEKLPEGSFSERMAHAERIQEAKDKEFSSAHPVLQTGAEIAGGLASTGALLKAAPKVAPRMLGLTGETLPAQVGQGIVAGGALGAADSATRGQDPTTGGMVGAITGGIAPVAARAVGGMINGARNLRAVPTEPQNFEEVAGKRVPVSVGQLTGDVGATMDEQRAYRGADSPKATAVAQDFFNNLQKPAVNEAGEAVARRMDPNGHLVATTAQEGAEGLLNALGQTGERQAAEAAAQAQQLGTARSDLSNQLSPSSAPSNPLDAASVVQSQVASMRQAEQTAAQQSTQRIAQQGDELMGSFHPQGEVVANSPMQAGGVVQDAISQARANAKAQVDDAYGALRNAEGRFHPATFNGSRNRIVQAVTDPERDIPNINAQTTPQAMNALNHLEDVTSGLTQQRANGRILPMQPLTGKVVDNARKRIGSFYQDARQAALSSGNWADVRATQAVKDAFDQEVRDAVASGKYLGGDGEQLLQKMDSARGLYSNYRKTFTRQGAGDKVGPMMESIVGQHEGQEAAPETVARMLTSGQNAPLLGKRVVDIFGHGSAEVGAVKQGLLHTLTTDGTGAKLPPEKAASNIEKMLHSSSLADVYFTPEERAALAQHAQDLRSTVQAPRAPTDVVSPAMERIAGDGGQAYTPQQVLDLTLGAKGVGQNPVGVQLAKHLKDSGNTEAVNALRSAAFERLHGTDSSETAANIREYLTGRGKAMADVLHTPQEQEMLKGYAAVHEAAAARAQDPRTVGGKLLQDMKGLTGRQPTATDVTAILNPRNGKERAVELAKSVISSEGENSPAHVAIKQGLWAQTLENKTGPMDAGSKAVISNLEEMLHKSGKPLADVVYSAQERALMQSYLDLMKKITPPNGTVNYSNTTSILSKMFRGGIDTLLGGIGALHFGPVGALAGVAADRSQGAVRDVIRSAKVARLLYGTPQGLHAAANLQRDLGRLAAFGQRATLPVMH